MGINLSRFVFQPPSPSYSYSDKLIWLKTKDNIEVPAFFLFNNRNKLTILLSHGNAEDIGMVVSLMTKLAVLWDVNFLAYEYPGYGLSKGKPSEKSVYSVIECAYSYLVEKCQIAPSKIVLYGRSLGTGASVHLAVKKTVGGMILQSPLLSIHRIILNTRFTLPGDMFTNIDKISKVKCPVFFIHGMQDDIVPFDHGVKLYNSCPSATTPYWIEGAGHNDIETIGQDTFILNILKFLKFVQNNNEHPSKQSTSYKQHPKSLKMPVKQMLTI